MMAQCLPDGQRYMHVFTVIADVGISERNRQARKPGLGFESH